MRSGFCSFQDFYVEIPTKQGRHPDLMGFPTISRRPDSVGTLRTSGSRPWLKTWLILKYFQYSPTGFNLITCCVTVVNESLSSCSVLPFLPNCLPPRLRRLRTYNTNTKVYYSAYAYARSMILWDSPERTI